jgi:hypothetical protein
LDKGGRAATATGQVIIGDLAQPVPPETTNVRNGSASRGLYVAKVR